ncbi:MAG: hypothetical protein IPJ97_13155 [Proteobacteria bacterium]|nr:hypothetical protein [Pseudomonadota bacterium]
MGLEGDLWFLSMASIPGRTIGKIDGVTGRFTSFVSLGERAGTNGRSHAIITARDGTIWFNHARGPQLLFGELGFMDPRTNATGRVAGPEITVKPVISSAPAFSMPLTKWHEIVLLCVVIVIRKIAREIS